MKREVEIVLAYPFKYTWKRDGALSHIGWLDSKSCALISGTTDAAAFDAMLTSANGNFALVHQTENGLFAATDRVRSFPLFYKLTPECLILTDNIDRCETGNTMDARAEQEFFEHYCVLGDKTLLPVWKQLQAGEWLCFDATANTIQVKRYFTFDDSGRDKLPDGDRMKQIYLDVFGRLVAASGGRPFIVPLSGGYDSRLIVACLNMLGAKHIFCYTYGRRDSPERIVAEQVARSLNLDWHFVEYTDALLDVFLQDDWNQYALKNHHYTSLPHEQDYFALYALKRDGMLPMNGIVLPGFLGDYFGGSMFRNKQPVNDPVHYQDWYIANRGCKFIINAVRLFEHFGLDWRLPFADRSILEFWLDISWKKRIYGNAYNDLVSETFFAPLGIDLRKPDHAYQAKPVRQLLKSLLPGNWQKAIAGARSYRPDQDPNNTRHLLVRLEQESRQTLKKMKIPFNEAHARYFMDSLVEKSVI